MRRAALLTAGIAGVVLALDIWTKRWATGTLAHRDPIPVLGEFVRLTYTKNSGVAFGLGAGLPFPYYVFSIIAVLAIGWLFLSGRARGLSRQIALALILGGAVGNLIDRLRTGEVVDFIEVGWRNLHWPVFNVADSAVTIGVVLFGLTLSRHRSDEREPDVTPSVPFDDPDAGPLGPGAERRGAAGSLPGSGADGPVA